MVLNMERIDYLFIYSVCQRVTEDRKSLINVLREWYLRYPYDVPLKQVILIAASLSNAGVIEEKQNGDPKTKHAKNCEFCGALKVIRSFHCHVSIHAYLKYLLETKTSNIQQQQPL